MPPPEVIEYKKLNILYPDGQKKPFDNPLIYYSFQHKLDKDIFGEYAQWSETVRSPAADGISFEDWKESVRGWWRLIIC